MARPAGKGSKSKEQLELQSAFGEALRSLRERKALSQEELAVAAGLHRNYIGAVERGAVNPTLWSIARLAKAMAVDASRLVAAMERARARH